jgi:hypothetical protein
MSVKSRLRSTWLIVNMVGATNIAFAQTDTMLHLNNNVNNCIRNLATLSISSPQNLSPFGVGTFCVTDHIAENTFCPKSGYSITTYKIDRVTDINVLGDGLIHEAKTPEGCLNIKIGGHSADHTGNYPHYKCSPMRFDIAIRWDECPR